MTAKIIISTSLFFTLFLPTSFFFLGENNLVCHANVKSVKENSKRIFEAELYGALCKECLSELIKEIEENDGVFQAKVKVIQEKKDRYGLLKVVYKPPKTTKSILIEIIKFRDLYPSAITDKPYQNKEHR